MRLEPVYLLAPKPKPPSVPTRRAFLIAGGTFFAGIGLGGACGYAAGSRAVAGSQEVEGAAASAGESQPKLPASSGNAELDELRRLALQAPIEELAERWLYFVDVFATSYRKDEYLPVGVERLVDHVLVTKDIKERRLMASTIAQIIELGETRLKNRLSNRVGELRKVR